MVSADQRAQVRSYLVNQGAKWSVEEIGARVGAAYDEMAQAVAGNLTPAQLTFKPGPEEWSVVEVMTHFLQANAGTCQAVLGLARGEDVARTSNPPRTVTANDDMPALVAESREQVMRTIRGFPANSNLEATRDHSFFGQLNCKAWLLFLRVHTLDHANQIKAVRNHQGFPGV